MGLVCTCFPGHPRAEGRAELKVSHLRDGFQLISLKEPLFMSVHAGPYSLRVRKEMQLSGSQDLECETCKNKTTWNIFCPSEHLISGRVLRSKQGVMVSYKLTGKKKNKGEKKRKRKKIPNQGRAGFQDCNSRRLCHYPEELLWEPL